MQEPGARVDGHRGAVRADGLTARASCTCGQAFVDQPTVAGACLLLVQHLQTAVRGGALVVPGGDDDGPAGVREPRRPVPSSG